ncbi:MAG: AAA family ATPase [Alphaproteobacteria bacterium]|nr:AAA family ATPase [Alphaproteobacteria bacterium]
MQRIAFYGKGGIGKSTIATGVSYHLAHADRKLLHVGCDPKADSSLVLVKDQERFRTVIGQSFQIDPEDLEAEDLIMEGIHPNIECIESGGPEAGVGCGGRAVSKSFEIFDELEIVDESLYDAAVFDVLGDVVCGGFAAPMRKAHGSKVCIILSEEMMACYAANNIAKACRRYADNGICLAGLVVNLRSNEADLAPIQRFADAIGTRILQVIPRDPIVGEAELFRKSVLEYAPDSPVAVAIRELAEKVWSLDPASCPIPEPLEGDKVRDVMRGPMRADQMARLSAK